MSDKALIDKHRLTQLIEAEKELELLYRAGVDNWEGYDEVMRELYNEQ